MVTRYSSDFFFFLPQVCFLVRRHMDKNRELKIGLRERKRDTQTDRQTEEIRSQFCHGSWHPRPSSPRAACCSPHAHCHDHQPWLLLQDTRVVHTPSSSFLPSFLLPWLERNTRRGAACEEEEEEEEEEEIHGNTTVVDDCAHNNKKRQNQPCSHLLLLLRDGGLTSQTKCYVHCEVFGSALRFWTLKHLWCTSSAKLSQTRCNYWITLLNWERALLQALCRERGHVKYCLSLTINTLLAIGAF